MKKYVLYKRIFLALTILAVAFIFGQSIMNRETSDQESGRLLSTLLSLLQGLGIAADPHVLHALVRKAAHFMEFAMLGVFVGGYTLNLGYLHGRTYLALPAWMTLMIALCDEFIQGFSGRASMVSDVVLDYSGAMFGLLMVAGFVLIKNKRARRKNHEN